VSLSLNNLKKENMLDDMERKFRGAHHCEAILATLHYLAKTPPSQEVVSCMAQNISQFLHCIGRILQSRIGLEVQRLRRTVEAVLPC